MENENPKEHYQVKNLNEFLAQLDFKVIEEPNDEKTKTEKDYLVFFKLFSVYLFRDFWNTFHPLRVMKDLKFLVNSLRVMTDLKFLVNH